MLQRQLQLWDVCDGKCQQLMKGRQEKQDNYKGVVYNDSQFEVMRN